MPGLNELDVRNVVTSTANRTIKMIRALRNRRERDHQGRFFAEGIRIVAEAAQTGAGLEVLVVAPELLTSTFARGIARRLADEGVEVVAVSGEVFRSISVREGPQGIGAVIKQRWHDLAALDPTQHHLWVALDAVQDPGNLGSIIRTTDAVGGGGVILVGSSADPYDPVAVRASMGSVFGLKLVRATAGELGRFKEGCGIPVVGTSGGADRHYRGISYPDPVVVLSGSERQGLAPDLEELCDDLVRIPMSGRCDSLNLAVATSVVLYEVFAQRETSR